MDSPGAEAGAAAAGGTAQQAVDDAEEYKEPSACALVCPAIRTHIIATIPPTENVSTREYVVPSTEELLQKYIYRRDAQGLVDKYGGRDQAISRVEEQLRAVRDRYNIVNDDDTTAWDDLIEMYLDMRKDYDYCDYYAGVPHGLGSTGDCAAVSFMDPAVDALCTRMDEMTLSPHDIFVKMVHGKTVRINCALDDTEDDIKLRLTQKLVQMGDVPLDGHEYYITRSCGSLRASVTLEQHGVNPGDTLMQQMRLVGGGMTKDTAEVLIEQMLKETTGDISEAWILKIYRRVRPSSFASTDTGTASQKATKTDGRSTQSKIGGYIGHEGELVYFCAGCEDYGPRGPLANADKMGPLPKEGKGWKSVKGTKHPLNVHWQSGTGNCNRAYHTMRFEDKDYAGVHKVEWENCFKFNHLPDPRKQAPPPPPPSED